MDFIGTFEPVKQEVASATSPASAAAAVAAAVSVSAKANLDNKDYSPFKSYTSGWGNANNDKENDKNFASVASAGSGIDLGSTGDLAAKAPGYRISPSGGPLLATQTGGWGAGTGVSTSSSMLVRPAVTNSTTVITSNSTFNTERSNSAPGSPIIPSPIGPPPGVVQMQQQAPAVAPSSGQAPQQQAPGNGNNSNKMMASSQSPGSEPDQYRA